MGTTDATTGGVEFKAGNSACFKIKAYNSNNQCTYDAKQPTWGSPWSEESSKSVNGKTITNCVHWSMCAKQIDAVTLDTERTNWFEMYVQWSAPSDNGGSPISHYFVQYKEENEADYSNMLSTKTTRIGIPGLTTKKNYKFKVTACNAVDCSTCGAFESSLIEYVTSAQPKKPNGLVEVVEETCCDRMTIRWQNSEDTKPNKGDEWIKPSARTDITEYVITYYLKSNPNTISTIVVNKAADLIDDAEELRCQ